MDDATVYDEGTRLLSARDPHDLGPLCEAMGGLLASRPAAAHPALTRKSR